MLLVANDVFLKETKKDWKYKQTFLNRLLIQQFKLVQNPNYSHHKTPPPRSILRHLTIL